jgi:hypothetical protein
VSLRQKKSAGPRISTPDAGAIAYSTCLSYLTYPTYLSYPTYPTYLSYPTYPTYLSYPTYPTYPTLVRTGTGTRAASSA